jgi:hypothetical protein
VLSSRMNQVGVELSRGRNREEGYGNARVSSNRFAAGAVSNKTRGIRCTGQGRSPASRRSRIET